MLMEKPQGATLSDEEWKIANDIAESSEWLELENRIIDLVEKFPGGRRVIAAWLRAEAAAVESEDPGAKYAQVIPKGE